MHFFSFVKNYSFSYKILVSHLLFLFLLSTYDMPGLLQGTLLGACTKAMNKTYNIPFLT